MARGGTPSAGRVPAACHLLCRHVQKTYETIDRVCGHCRSISRHHPDSPIEDPRVGSDQPVHGHERGHLAAGSRQPQPTGLTNQRR